MLVWKWEMSSLLKGLTTSACQTLWQPWLPFVSYLAFRCSLPCKDWFLWIKSQFFCTSFVFHSEVQMIQLQSLWRIWFSRQCELRNCFSNHTERNMKPKACRSSSWARDACLRIAGLSRPLQLGPWANWISWGTCTSSGRASGIHWPHSSDNISILILLDWHDQVRPDYTRHFLSNRVSLLYRSRPDHNQIRRG